MVSKAPCMVSLVATDGNVVLTIQYTHIIQKILRYYYWIVLLSPHSFIMSSPDISPSIKCLRCSDCDLQCSVPHEDSIGMLGRSKFLCNHCDAAGLNCCIFPPSIRFADRSNSTCISCRQHNVQNPRCSCSYGWNGSS